MKNGKRFLSVFERDARSLRFRRSAVTAEGVGFALTLAVMLLLLTGLWWLISVPSDFVESGWKMVAVICWNAVLALPLIFTAALLLWAVFAVETGTLDEDGFRYEFRVLVPLRRFAFPLDEVICFQVMPPELSGEEDEACQTLAVCTDRGCLIVFHELVPHWFAQKQKTPTAKLMRATQPGSEIGMLADAANRVLAALKNVAIGDDSPVRAKLEHPPLRTPLHPGAGGKDLPQKPDGSRWEIDMHEEGSSFCRPCEISSRKLMKYLMFFLITGYGAAVAITGWMGIPFARNESETAVLAVLACGMGMFAAFFLGTILWMLSARLRRQCFGVNHDTFYHGTRVLGMFFGTRIPRSACVEIGIDDCPQTPPGSLTQCWRKMMPPHFVLKFFDAHGTVLMEITGLSRAEAQWFHDDILRNY